MLNCWQPKGGLEKPELLATERRLHSLNCDGNRKEASKPERHWQPKGGF
jgi:hypothetical protein